MEDYLVTGATLKLTQVIQEMKLLKAVQDADALIEFQ